MEWLENVGGWEMGGCDMMFYGGKHGGEGELYSEALLCRTVAEISCVVSKDVYRILSEH